MDLLNSNLWKTALIQDWLAILVTWMVLFIAAFFGGSMLFRLWRRIARSRKATLRFVTYERGTFWTRRLFDSEEVVQVRGVWHVTNVSLRKVALTNFRLRGLTTEHHSLAVRGADGPEQLLVPDEEYDVELNCMVGDGRKRKAKLFRADVYFRDSDGREHRLRRVPFVYRMFAGDRE